MIARLGNAIYWALSAVALFYAAWLTKVLLTGEVEAAENGYIAAALVWAFGRGIKYILSGT